MYSCHVIEVVRTIFFFCRVPVKNLHMQQHDIDAITAELNEGRGGPTLVQGKSRGPPPPPPLGSQGHGSSEYNIITTLFQTIRFLVINARHIVIN